MGGAIFLAAAVPLGILVGLPRFLTFGIALGAALVVVSALGISSMLGAFATGDDPEPISLRGWWRRPGFLVVLLGAVLFLPQLGAGGLWDPWETHYGEVARRMLERDDWISMWWQNEWFYSKPILVMWLQAVGMALVGANPFPDGQPFGAAWGMRFPVTVLAITSMWAGYHFVSKVFGRRAGFVSALALGTMPTFAFLAHQTMTDMPYVSTMSIALCLLGCALVSDDDELVRERRLSLGRLGAMRVSAVHLLVQLLVLFVLPFNLYLLSRPMSYEAGSAGQENVRVVSQVVPAPLAVVGVPALIGLAWVLFTLRRERRLRRIYLLAAYFFVSLSFLGKVLPGIFLPFVIFGGWVLVTGRWGVLKRLEIWRGLAIFCIVGMPWYVAKLFRHGQPFIDRIVFHDLVNRAVVGVHGDTGTVEYFVQQLGYGMFPWLALVPLALFAGAWRGEDALETSRGQARAFLTIWAFVLFIFFCGVITKFHHYIFPTIVPVALLVGIAFDDLMAGRIRRPEPAILAGLAILGIVGADLAHGPGQGKPGYERFVDLFIYNYRRIWPEGEEYDFSGQLLALVVIAIAVALPLLVPKLRRPLGGAVCVFAFLFGVWALDVYMPAVGPHWSQRNLIEAYYERRDSPEERLVAYQMNWKGENFYTGNRVVVLVSLDTGGFERWIRQRQGERHFFITERSRFEGMRSALNRASSGAGTRLTEIGPPPGPERGRLCNKFRIGVTTL